MHVMCVRQLRTILYCIGTGLCTSGERESEAPLDKHRRQGIFLALDKESENVCTHRWWLTETHGNILLNHGPYLGGVIMPHSHVEIDNGLRKACRDRSRDVHQNEQWTCSVRDHAVAQHIDNNCNVLIHGKVAYPSYSWIKACSHCTVHRCQDKWAVGRENVSL